MKKYLWDSNAVIDYLEGRFRITTLEILDKLVNAQPFISVISQIELLGWHNANAFDLKIPSEFVAIANVLELNSKVVLKTIEIRQQIKIKLPDAVIAATALVNELVLLTSNTSDFKKIDRLVVINPKELQDELI